MRRDMSKVIVERPRWGSRMSTARRFRRFDPKQIAVEEWETERLPAQLGHKFGARLRKNQKSLNENLAPLRRFLLAQVGRPWDAVWSEISENLRPSNTVQQHVRDHVEDFVAIRAFLKDGELWFQGRRGPTRLDDPYWSWKLLYVDPATGILRRAPTRFRYGRRLKLEKLAEERELLKHLRRLANDRVLVLLDDGNWWDVTLARTPARQVGGAAHAATVIDVIETASLSQLPRERRYGAPGVHAVAKRPLSKKELKAHGLRG